MSHRHHEAHHEAHQKAGGDAGAGGDGGHGGGLFSGIFDAMKQASESMMKGQPPDFSQMAQSMEKALQQDIYGGGGK